MLFQMLTSRGKRPESLVQPLASVLPRIAVRTNWVSPVEKGVASQSSQRLAAQKQEMFPKLEAIVFGYINDLDEQIERDCEGMGPMIRQLRGREHGIERVVTFGIACA